MMNSIYLSVSCNHNYPAYRRESVRVEARPSRQGEGKPDLWYVSMDGFGCSKDYAKPEDAVIGMLQSHACYDIRISRIHPPADEVISWIQDALGTGEHGEALVEVARNAHAAELKQSGERYEGFANHETWLAYQWLIEESSVYFPVRKLARECESDYAAGEKLKEAVPEMLDFPVTGLAADFVNASMRRVDWMEIAQSLRAE